MPKDNLDTSFDSGLDFDRYVHSPGGIGRRSRSPERFDPTGTDGSPVPTTSTAGTVSAPGATRPSWLPAATTVPAGNPRTWRLGGAAVSLTMGLVATGIGLHIALGAVGVSPVVPPSDDGPGVVEEVEADAAPAAVPMPVEEVDMEMSPEETAAAEAAAAEAKAAEAKAAEAKAAERAAAEEAVPMQEAVAEEMSAPVQEMAPQEMMSPPGSMGAGNTGAEGMGAAGTGMNR